MSDERGDSHDRGDNAKPSTVQNDVDKSRRRLLKCIGKGVYVAPVALSMMSTKASACSLTC